MNNNKNFNNTPRVQLSCALCTYKTFSQDILDDHMDSQHRGLFIQNKHKIDLTF